MSADVREQPFQKEREGSADGLTIDERVQRLRTAFAGIGASKIGADWANFGNEWGQGGGFDNKVVFEKYT